MRNSFAFLPVRQKQRFGSVKPSPATVRRTVALKSSNPSAEWQNKNTTHRVVFLFWQRMRDSNPRERSQSPVCYRYTNPLSGRFIIRNFSEKSTLRPDFFKNSPIPLPKPTAPIRKFMNFIHKFYRGTMLRLRSWGFLKGNASRAGGRQCRLPIRYAPWGVNRHPLGPSTITAEKNRAG